MKNDEILVSVCMITYNHEEFICEAIEGVLMQKTNFPIELIIGEDCSTDNTRKIVLEYAEKHPDIICPLLPESNLGMMKNFIQTMEAARGKYIALCEGDDYWTDPYKLQKQVDFLEANEEYTVCSHRFHIYNKNANKLIQDHLADLFLDKEFGCEFDLEANMKYAMSKTLTLLFRRSSIDFSLLNQYKYTRDVHLQYHLLNQNRKGYCLSFFGGVYNEHEGGVYSSIDILDKRKITCKIFQELVYLNNGDEVLIYMYQIANENLLRIFRQTIKQRKIIKNRVIQDLYFLLRVHYDKRGLLSVIDVVVKLAKSFLLSLFR